jgi:hypothetical protein
MTSLLRHKKLGPHARDSICAIAFLDSVHRHPEPKGLRYSSSYLFSLLHTHTHTRTRTYTHTQSIAFRVFET